MYRLPLMSLVALSLVACNQESDSDVSVSGLGRTARAPSVAWASPAVMPEASRGETGEAATPVEGPVALSVASSDVPAAGTDAPDSVEERGSTEEEMPLEIEVRAGESLVRLAEWSGLSVEAIAEANSIRTGATLYPGQRLEVPIDDETYAAMQDTRDRYEDARLDRYLTRRGTLVGVTSHTVGTGETAWQIAEDHGELPLWVMASFNRGKNLDRLRIGEEINLPMLGDSVAMEEAPTEEESAQAESPSGSSGSVSETPEAEISTNP